MNLRYMISAFVVLALPLSASQQKPLLDAPLVIAGPTERMVKTLDLNGDGWTDAVGWWQTSVGSNGYATAAVQGWINDGTGKLVKQPWTSNYQFSTTEFIDPHDGSEVGDLNGDGKDDFVFASLYEVRIYVSNGAAEPSLFATLPTSVPVEGLALADFDLDGRLDLALVVISEPLRIYRLNWTTHALEVMSERPLLWSCEGRLIAAELTGDDTPDLLYSGRIVFPVSQGVLQTPVSYPFPWGGGDYDEFRHDVGDVDGDGDLDVVTFRVRSDIAPEYHVLRRTGPGTFVSEPRTPGGPARRLVDLDGDGDLDGTCCGGGGSEEPPLNTQLSRFRMSWNDGTGRFSASDSMPGLGSSAIAGTVDLDQDGDLDLVAGRCVYYANGPIHGSAFVPFGTRVQSDRSLLDYDGESDPDAELTLQGVRVNLGDGTNVASPVVLPPPPSGHSRAGKGMAGDWDGDGNVDLLALLGTANAPTGLELLRNVGCGSFESKGIVAGAAGLTASTPSGIGAYPVEIDDSLAADMDGDGDLDLVRRTWTQFLDGVFPQFPFWSSWFRNDGAAGFTYVEDFPDYLVISVGDLNGDAFPDLLAIQRLTNNPYDTDMLEWAAGMPGGGFNRWTVVPQSGVRNAQAREQVSIADVDGDGDSDLVHANFFAEGKVKGQVHLNDGLGHFDRAEASAVDLVPLSKGAALAADLNADGLVDLAFGPLKNAGSAAAIYLRKADNSGWEAPFSQVFIETVGPAAEWNSVFNVRDLDGDRDLDLITNSIVRNRTFEGTEAGERVQVQGGTAGFGGIVPNLGASGPFRVGTAPKLRLRGARPAAAAELLIQDVGTMPATFGGGRVRQGRLARYVDITTSGYAYDPPGSGTWTSLMNVPGTFAGRTFSYEFFVADPAAPGGTARSNVLYLTYGW